MTDSARSGNDVVWVCQAIEPDEDQWSMVGVFATEEAMQDRMDHILERHYRGDEDAVTFRHSAQKVRK